VYFHPQVRRVLANGVQWAAPIEGARREPEVTNPSVDWFAR
jgi:trehalose utilization protein